MVETHEVLGCSSTILPAPAPESLITAVQLRVQKLGRYYQIIIRFDFRVDNYPFQPLRYSIDENDYNTVATNEDYEYIRKQMQLVCPELNNWRGKDVSNLSLICSDFWSPGMTMKYILLKVHTRFAAVSFPEAYHTIVSFIQKPPSISNTSADSAVLWVLIGTVGEPPPAPTPGCTNCVILLDPKWCAGSTTGVIHWKNKNFTFMALSAPYCCYKDERSMECMESLLDHCEMLGYKKMVGLSSGISIPLPSRVTRLSSSFPTTWERVPKELSRENGGITAGSYGG